MKTCLEETQQKSVYCANPVCGHVQDGDKGHEGGVGGCLVCTYCAAFMSPQILPKIVFIIEVE